MDVGVDCQTVNWHKSQFQIVIKTGVFLAVGGLSALLLWGCQVQNLTMDVYRPWQVHSALARDVLCQQLTGTR